MDFSWVLQIIALGDSWATSVSSALEPSFGTVNTTHVEPSRPVSFRCFQESAWYDFSFYQWLLLEGSIFSAEMFGRALVSVFEIVGLVRCWQYWFNFCLYMVVGAPSKNYLLDYGWMITVWNAGRSALTRWVEVFEHCNRAARSDRSCTMGWRLSSSWLISLKKKVDDRGGSAHKGCLTSQS